MLALIADDSGVIRSVVKRAFAELGVEEIDEAIDGRQAIEMVEDRPYDLIVTDWNMPFNTGLDVIKAARAAGQTCPIVMQTTESDRSKVMSAIAAGVNDYILKPFNKEDIREKLERHVAAGRENSLTR
jgi:two-component system chemotaxis response regulator CheY